jgi:hypothetical protein
MGLESDKGILPGDIKLAMEGHVKENYKVWLFIVLTFITTRPLKVLALRGAHITAQLDSIPVLN